MILSAGLFGLVAILALLQQPMFVLAQERAPLKVGFIGSLSGPAQPYGDACKNGFEMALDALGRDWIRVFYEDDQFMPSKTVSAFTKLVDLQHVDVVITVGSSPSSAVAPLAENRGIPLIAWASDRRVAEGRSFVVRSYPSGRAEGELAAAEALRRGLKPGAVAISSNAYAQSWREGVSEAYSQGRLVLDEEVAGDVSDFRSLAVRAKQTGAQAMGVCLDPGKSALFARQIRELETPITLFGCEYLNDPAEVQAARGAFRGAWFATVPVKQDFQKRYEDRFGRASVISGAANHYDLVLLLSKLRPGVRGKELLQNLIQIGTVEGVVGPFSVRERAGDRFFDIPLTLKFVS